MACPFFDPTDPFSWEAWPNPPRMTLGDPYHGVCTAIAGEVPSDRVRTCCNAGYARGTCPSFPVGDVPDTVRFGIVKRDAGIAVLRYVRERNHHPHDDGTLELPEPGSAGESTLIERQARAFLSSYLRRNL